MKIKKPFTTAGSGKIYFISDLHYGHENVIKYDSRPFKDVTEMNNYILEELKKTKEEDIIFDLGDMFWKMPVDDIKDVLNQIPCKNIYKIVGNHDNYGLYFDQAPLKGYFKIISDILDVHIEHLGKDYMELCVIIPLYLGIINLMDLFTYLVTFMVTLLNILIVFMILKLM